MPAKKSTPKVTKRTGVGSHYSHKRGETQLLIEQAALYRLSVALNHETELQAMMDVAVRVAAELFKVELAAIALVDEGGDTYSGKANIGWSPEFFSFAQHIPLDSDNGLSYAIYHHTVVAIPDELNETRWGVPPWVLQMGIASALITPMSVAGKTVGGLIINDRHRRDWSDGEQRLIALIANNTAEAIERVNLFGRLEKGERRFRALIEHSAGAVALVNADGIIQYQSSSAWRVLGDVRIGQNAFELIHPDDITQAIESFKQLLEAPQSSVMAHFRFRHSRGVWIWLEATGTNLLDDPDVQGIVVNFRDINERKRAEEALRESQERYEWAIRATNEGIWEWDITTNRVYSSPRWKSILGFEDHEIPNVIGELEKRLHPDDREQVAASAQACFDGQAPGYELEFRALHKDGAYRWINSRAIIVRDANGKPLRLVGAHSDITERKQAEVILRESEERFSKIFHSSPIAIGISTLAEGQFIDVNQAFVRMLGFNSNDELIGKTSAELNVWADIAERTVMVEQLQQQGYVQNWDIRFRTRSGEARDSLTSVELIELGGNRYALSFLLDITERKRVDELLKSSQTNLSALIENAADSIWSVDANYRLIVFNTTFKRLFSMAFHGKPEEGLVFMEYMPLEFKSVWKDFFDRALKGERFSTDYRYDFPNKPLDFEIAFNPIVAADQSITGVAVFARNVTERKHLELQQQRLTTALESAGEMIIITDTDAQIQYVNAAFEHITGYTRDEALGQNPNILQGGKHEDEFYRAMWSALRQGDVWHGVVTDKKKSGDLFESENTIAPIHDASGGTVGYVSVQRDITERVQRERELEAIAQLSAALRTAAALADMTPILLDQLLDLLKADSAALIVRDPVSGDSVVEAVRGSPILTAGDRLAAGKGVAGYVIESGQPYLSQDLENDPRFARRIMIQGQWAAAFTPLATREQIIGALCIARQSASIPNEDMRLLNTIGELAASAIHRASLHEQTRRRLEQLSTLHHIDRAISSSFDLRLTLNIALDELTQHAGVGAASVLFLNQHTMTLEYAAERGFPRQLPKASQLHLNHSFAGRAVLERQAVVADLTAFKGYPHLESFAKEGFTRYDGVPLIAKGKIKGVLEVFSHPSLGAEQNWVEFLETVSNGLALAVDNMELFNGLQRSNSELGLAYDATLEGWSRALDLRDKETEGHTQRVTEMTLRLAHAMNLEAIEITQLRRGALLHDIGKLGVPDRILFKPGPLSDDEWELMRKHPQYAYDMLLPISYLAPALAIPYCHPAIPNLKKGSIQDVIGCKVFGYNHR